MKIPSTELKVHLGRYLRQIERENTTLEVCIRDRTVAYLVPASSSENAFPADGSLHALKNLGLKVRPATSPTDVLPEPVLAGDGRDDVATVEQMRKSRDW